MIISAPPTVLDRLRRVRWWQALFVLALLGQFLAPLFVRLAIWPFLPIGRFIYWLGMAICPIAWDTPSFLGLPMIVCPLCYGALVTLTAITFSYPRPRKVWRRWFEIPALLRLTIGAELIVPWLCGYIFIKASLWQMDYAAMFGLGLVGGLGTALVGYECVQLSRPVLLRGKVP